MVRWLWDRGPNYERELPKLAEQINKQRNLVLSAVNAHRLWPSIFVQQCLSIYVLYVAYYFLLASAKHLILYRSILALCPIFVVFFYNIISRITLWRKTKLEKKLEILISKRKTLVDAYKKKTHYDEIQKLIGEDVSNPEETKIEHQKADQCDDVTAQNQVVPFKNPDVRPEPVPVYHTSWVDRVLDVLIGGNENSPTNRFALICEKCHAHNGLAPYGKTVDQVVYKCPVCGHQNGSDSSDYLVLGDPSPELSETALGDCDNNCRDLSARKPIHADI